MIPVFLRKSTFPHVSWISELLMTTEKCAFWKLKNQVLTWLSATVGALMPQHIMDVDKLPKTYKAYKAAIKITRHLGLRYLWIDSLCICQDDPEDWARESASMRQVYAGASLHIPSTSQRTKHFGVVAGSNLMGSPLHLERGQYKNGSFQRIVHFAADEIFFEYNCHFISEGGVEVYPGFEKGFAEMARASRVSATHKLWYLIMDDYMGRALTVKTDRSLLFLATEYVAGFWRHDKEDKVLPDTRPLHKEGGYIAPTWSPASFDGRLANGMRDQGWVDVATVLNFNVTLKNKQNPFGEVVDGSITLRAPVTLPVLHIGSPIRLRLRKGRVIHDEQQYTIGLSHIILGAKFFFYPHNAYIHLGIINASSEDQEQGAFYSFLDTFHPDNWKGTDERVLVKKALDRTPFDDERIILAPIYLLAVRDTCLGLLMFAFQFFDNMVGVIILSAAMGFMRIGDAGVIYKLGGDRNAKMIRVAMESFFLGVLFLVFALYLTTTI
ncbi:het-domain-containing protein [Fusarium mundagurra]|uniref:Het-domain-containing protein n=1 Tax=Fusarium mundagurra TaxID=1567541 RepID=A0A8H6DGC9_9HYPO|nr:het-domain-containing protein [Fusarium mundagurra]